MRLSHASLGMDWSLRLLFLVWLDLVEAGGNTGAAEFVMKGRFPKQGSLPASSVLPTAPRRLNASISVQTYFSAPALGRCRALQSMPPPAFERYSACVEAGIVKADLGIPGIVSHVKSECWCSLGLGSLVADLGCCEDPSFEDSCALQCNPDCDSQEAQQCLADCPAICLESQYAVPACEASCAAGDCRRFQRCATRASLAKAHSVSDASKRVCDERSFVHAPELKEYLRCMVANPHLKPWLRHSAAESCACAANLADAAHRANCCGATWAAELCDRRCSGVDCASSEARACAQTCSLLCPEPRSSGSGPCYQTCFKHDGKCTAYAQCEPKGIDTYDYVCDDGSTPQATGCCAPVAAAVIRSEQLQCPSTCDRQRRQRAVAAASPGLYVAEAVGSFACSCSGCPKDVAEAKQRMGDLIRAEVSRNGEQLLAAVTREAGLRRPTARMQQLMSERNAGILRALDGRSGAAERADTIQVANSLYLKLIEEAALTAAGGGSEDSSDPREGGHDGGPLHSSAAGSGNGASTHTALLVSVSVLATLVILLAVCLGYSLATRKTLVHSIDISLRSQGQGEVVATTSSRATATIVVGHPIAVSPARSDVDTLGKPEFID